MLDPIDPKPRGFSGRPLVGLLFAIAVGGLVSYIGSRLQWNPVAVFMIIVGAVGAVAYSWHRAEGKR
jgi:hypothetical protein